MNNNIAVDYKTPNKIRRMGIGILTKELGPVGMVRFIQQFDRGEGDYTAEREELLADVAMDEVLQNLRKTDQEI